MPIPLRGQVTRRAHMPSQHPHPLLHKVLRIHRTQCFRSISALLVVLFLTSVGFLLFPSATMAQAVQETGFVDENYINAGSVPMGFVFAPDGRMFVWYKQGLVKIYKGTTLVGTFLDIQSRVNTGVDRGLVGFALDPNFATNGFVYAGYVFENAGTNTSQLPRTEREIGRAHV